VAASQRGYASGEIGVRLTDDETIHKINAQYLDHDYPTDVISFPYDCQPDWVSGELVASVDTAFENAAIENADAGDWDVARELVLYVIHGVLHITGMEDASDEQRRQMRTAERRVLEAIGSQPSGDGPIESRDGGNRR